MAPDLYRAKPVYVRPVSNKESLLELADGSATAIIPTPLAELVIGCQEFSTLQSHVRRFWDKSRWSARVHLMNGALQFGLSHQQFLPFTARPILDFLTLVLTLLKNMGFLISIDEFLQGSGTPPSSSLISTVGFVTKNRPDHLYRGAQSFLENSLKHERQTDFAIFDDSDGEETRQRLKALPKSHGKILYAGQKEKKAFIRALADQGINPDVLKFLFFGMGPSYPTQGGNRNAFLLHVMGEMAFSADDESVCRVARSPSYQSGVKIGWEGMRENMWHFPDRESALKSVPPVDVDILALHEAVLGRSSLQVIQQEASVQEGAGIFAKGMDGNFLDLIYRHKSKVVATLNGLVGDSGMKYSDIFLFYDGDARKRLLVSEPSFRTAFESREIVKFHEMLLLSRATDVMTGFFGVDARVVVPPFFPMFRGEDGLFGRLIGATLEGASVAFLPWILLHDPEGHRNYGSEFDEGNIHLPVSPPVVIQGLISELGSSSLRSSAAESLRYVGLALKDYGSMPNQEFRDILRRQRLQVVSNEMAHLHEMLRRHPDSPPFYKMEVNRRIDAARRLLTRPISESTPLLIDTTTFELQKGVQFVQEAVSRFGEALIEWPALVEATKILKEKGLRLAQPI